VHFTQFYHPGRLRGKNYQSWWKFDNIMTKTILIVFFLGLGVRTLLHCCER